MIKDKKFWFALAVVLTIASAVLFLRLPRTPLTNWDEGIYAEVARTMHAGGSWWLPTYHGPLFLEKPPLTFWLMNGAMCVFGVNEFAARFWSALAGVATAGLLTVWMWQLRKKAWLALLAGLIFVAGRFVMFHAFRTGDTDALLVLFSTFTLYSYWRTQDNQRWWWAVGIASGLAVMTKSFIGLLPQLVIVIDLLISRGYRTISWRRAMEGLGLLLLIAIPWHFAVAVHHGSELWHQAIGFNLLERSSTTIASLNAPWYWYAQTMFNFFFPWGAFVPLAIILGVWRWRGGETISRTLLVWVAVIFIIFAFSATKYDHYIQPLYPALAMMVVLMIEQLWETRNFWIRFGFWLSLVVVFFSFPPRLAHEGFLWRLTPFAWLPSSWVQGIGARLIVAKVTTLIIFLILWGIARAVKKSTTRLAVALVSVYLFVIALGWQYSYLKHLPTTSNAKQVAEKIAPSVAGRIDVVGISHLSEPALYFYLGRLTTTREVIGGTGPSAQTVVSSEAGSAALRSQGYSIVASQGPYTIWKNSSE